MGGFVREGVAELLNHPASGWIPGHVEVKDPASPVVDREPHVERPEADGRNNEEVHPGDQVSVITQEGDPALGRTRSRFRFRQIARDRREAQLNPELRQFGLDLSSSPVILRGNSVDQLFRLFGDRRSPRSRNGDRSPVATESLAVPPDHGLRLNDEENLPPSRVGLG